MDRASVTGIIFGIGALLVGQVLEGGRLSSLVQPAAFAIVFVGTVGAVLLQTEMPTFQRAMRMARWVFQRPPSQRTRLAGDIAKWSLHARRDGLLSLEQFMLASKDAFIQKGLRLVIDGIAPDKVRSLLETDLSAYEFRERQGAKVWEAAAGYAPTIGILGAVLGLIHVMENLGDPSKLGNGIAVAFVATVYGVGFANLLFFPIANKLKTIIADNVSQYEVLTDVFQDIAGGDHSRVIEERVACLLARAH